MPSSVPVVGGNVSLYNESDGVDIDPTPVVGMIGLVDALDRRPPGVGLRRGHRPGAPRRTGHHAVRQRVGLGP